MIAGACGLMLFASCLFASNGKVQQKVAGAGSMIRVTV